MVIAGGNGAPLLQPRPEPLHVVAIGVDPVRAGDLFLVAPRGDGRASPQVPDVLAKGVAAQASVRHHPFRHPGQTVEEWNRMGQLMRLTRSQDEGHRASEPISDHASLGPIPTTRPAQGFTGVPLRWRAPFRAAPAAFWWARMLV